MVAATGVAATAGGWAGAATGGLTTRNPGTAQHRVRSISDLRGGLYDLALTIASHALSDATRTYTH